MPRSVLIVCVLALFVVAPCSARSAVIISEIMYNPAGVDRDASAAPPFNREWVELYNAGSAAVDLSGWQFGDAQDGEWSTAFPAGTTLGPGQALVVTGDEATFTAQWGGRFARVEVGNFPVLANDPSPRNETAALRDGAGVLQDVVNFDDDNGWFKVTGSQGQSLFALPQGLDPAANNVGGNWRPSSWGAYGAWYRGVGGANQASPGVVVTQPQPAFAPSPDAAWSMVVIPDTQNYVKSSGDYRVLGEMIDWIKNGREEFKIQVVLQEGDIVNQNSQESPITSGDQTATQQWTNARTAFAKLNGVVPYIMATGNHDHGPTSAQTRDTRFNDFFRAADNPLVDPVQGGMLAGTMQPGRLENAYYDFTAPDGRKMLIFSLEWGPRQAVVDWANDVAGQPQFADHTAVLLTHAYMNHDERRYNWAVSQDGGNPHAYGTADDTNDGQELWNELVKRHGNFAMTLNGHVGSDGVGYLASRGDQGNVVHQMLFNTQFSSNGGDGWIRLLEFLDDGRTVRVRTYSPYLGMSKTDAANSFEITIAQLSQLSTLAGDFNADGVVDEADLVVWSGGFGATPGATRSTGDADGDGDVDGADFLAWQNDLRPASPATAAVPEPAGACWIAASLLLQRLFRGRIIPPASGGR